MFPKTSVMEIDNVLGEMDLFVKMNTRLTIVTEVTNILIFYIFEYGTENSAQRSADLVLNCISYKCN